jgi:hypothetical protein
MSYLVLAKKIEKNIRRRDTCLETGAGVVPVDDPVVSPDQWFPSFREFHHNVVCESPDFDYGELRKQNLNLYRRIKVKENEIDALGSARLSDVMALMREWRELILRACFDQRAEVRKQDDRTK